MSTYVISAKTAGGGALVSVSIGAIDQEERVVPELDVVHALKNFLGTVPGVGQVVAQKYEQVITVV